MKGEENKRSRSKHGDSLSVQAFMWSQTDLLVVHIIKWLHHGEMQSHLFGEN